MMQESGAPEPALPGGPGHGSHGGTWGDPAQQQSYIPHGAWGAPEPAHPATAAYGYGPRPPQTFFGHLATSVGLSFVTTSGTGYSPVEPPPAPPAAGRVELLAVDTDATPRPPPPPPGKPSVMLSHAEMQARYGLGIRFYFDFILFVIYSNALLVVLSALNVIPHFFALTRTEGYQFALEDLWTCSYAQPFEWTAWKISWGLLLPVTFCFGPLYYVWQARWFSRHRDVPEVDVFARRDAIPENAGVSLPSRVARLLLSYTVFAGMLVSVYFATDFFTRRQIEFESGAPSRLSRTYGFAILIACFLIVLNMVWRKLCYLLTDFERLSTISAVRRHNCLKLILFKILALLVLTRAQTGAADAAGQCVTEVLGRQFFALILLELTVFNLLELLTPAILRALSACLPCLRPSSHPKGPGRTYSMGGGPRRVALGPYGDEEPLTPSSDGDADKPDFDVAEDYLELIYRQYLIYVGSGVFPLLPAVGLITNALEYFIDRYRLTRQCRPPVLRGSLKSLLLFSLTLAALAAALSPPRLTSETAAEGATFFWRKCVKAASIASPS
eukprot:tig00000821_g4488.t1